MTTDVSVYTYNGQHFRITEASGGQGREMYYNASWQLVEEHVDEPGEDPDRIVQHFWGKRYIDDAVMHRIRDVSDEAWDDERTFFHLTDPMYSTLAIVDATGMLKERVSYSSYGIPTATRPGDVNGDGVVGGSDINGYFSQGADIANVGTNTNYTVELDLDRDGDVDYLTDYYIYIFPEGGKSELGAGVLSDAAVVDGRTGYDGYRWEPETALWHVRYRAYDPQAGRWLQRDLNSETPVHKLYLYVESSTLNFIDPFGLALHIPDEDWGGFDKRQFDPAEYGPFPEVKPSRGNCYRFACDDPLQIGDDPRKHSINPGNEMTLNTCKELLDAAKKDGAVEPCNSVCPPGHTMIAGAVSTLDIRDILKLNPGEWPGLKPGVKDFHWWRRQPDGTWKHKPGNTKVTDRDDDNKLILDPSKSNNGVHDIFCGFLCMPDGTDLD